MRRHLREFIEGMPRSTDAWTCPYYMTIASSSLFCVGFGLADQSFVGSVVAAGAAALGGGVTGMRKRNDGQDVDSCSR